MKERGSVVHHWTELYLPSNRISSTRRLDSELRRVRKGGRSSASNSVHSFDLYTAGCNICSSFVCEYAPSRAAIVNVHYVA